MAGRIDQSSYAPTKTRRLAQPFCRPGHKPHFKTKRIVDTTINTHLDYGVALCRFAGAIYVTDVYEESKAWSTGLQVGDEILAVNGVDLSPYVSPAAVLLLMRQSEQLRLELVDAPLVTSCQLAARQLDQAFSVQEGSIVIPGDDGEEQRRKIIGLGNRWMLGLSDAKILQYIEKSVKRHENFSLVTVPLQFADAVACSMQQRVIPHDKESLNALIRFEDI